MNEIITFKPYKGIILNFDTAKHRFSVDGKSVPGVTSITGVIDKSQPLIFWAVGLFKTHLLELVGAGTVISPEHIEEGAKQHRIRKEAAATKGTAVHDFAEQFIAGKKPKIPTDDENVANGINAFLEWVKATNIEFIESEKIVYSKKNNFAGIADLIAKIDGELTLVDFKTSKGIYPEMYLQVAAYQLAFEEMSGQKIKKRIICKFDKESGEFSVTELKDDAKDKKAFLAALTLKKRLGEIKL